MVDPSSEKVSTTGPVAIVSIDSSGVAGIKKMGSLLYKSPEQTDDNSSTTMNKVYLDPDNAFERALIGMVDTHRKKSQDYGAKSDPYDNFIDSSRQIEDVPGKSVEVLIATKQARLKHLLFQKGKSPANEAIEDTLLDRAVYSVIAMVLYERGDYDVTNLHL